MKNFSKSYYFMLIFLAATSLSQSQLRLIATMSGDSTGDIFGSAVSGVGDVNGDGYDDVLVGAPVGNYAKLFFGGAVFDTNNYVKLVGDREQMFSRFGLSVGGGDVNGDGYSDVVISAPYYWIGGQFGIADAGRVYIYFGGQQFDTIPDLTLEVGGWYYKFGRRVAVVDDVNGDGYKDIVVGAPNDDWDAHGRVFIYYGGPTMDNVYDILLEGEKPFDLFGTAVSGAGDVNKDGYGEILIGAPQHLTRTSIGKAYLVFGGQSISLSNSRLFAGDSLYGQFGREVAGLGDVNGDTFPDLGIMGLNKIQVTLGDTNILNYRHVELFEKPEWGHFTQISCGIKINSDKYNDFVIGVEKSNGEISGAVLITYGDSLFKYQAITELAGPLLPSNFGTSISSVGKLIDNSTHCFIIGSINGEEQYCYGKVYVYYYLKTDGVNEELGFIPQKFQLYQNYPNPFNSQTIISFDIIEYGIVTIKIYDIIGREIATLLNENKYPGSYTVHWNAEGLPTGVYFCRFTTKNSTMQRKMILLR